MDKKLLISIAVTFCITWFTAWILSIIVTEPSDIEYLDRCATMPAQDLKNAARKTTEEIKESNATADKLNARKTVILAVQDANS